MKRIFTVFILVVSMNVFSKAGPQVPVPELTFQGAYEIAHNELLTKKFNHDSSSFHAKDYILGSINYQRSDSLWVWVINFFHPVANDHNVTFYVSQKGKVVKHEATQ